MASPKWPKRAWPKVSRAHACSAASGSRSTISGSSPAIRWLHSHDSDCLYYIIAGDIRMGTEKMGPGDGFFLPAETPYTYYIGDKGVEILEFRTEEDFNIQFKGKTEAYWEQMLQKLRSERPQWREALPPSRDFRNA